MIHAVLSNNGNDVMLTMIFITDDQVLMTLMLMDTIDVTLVLQLIRYGGIDDTLVLLSTTDRGIILMTY